MSEAALTGLITGATAIFTGGLGYLGARQQSRTELRKLEHEREDPATAGNQKFRQDVYLRYLEAIDAFYGLGVEVGNAPEGEAATTLGRVLDRFARADDEVELFGADAVLPARKAIWAAGMKVKDQMYEALVSAPPRDEDFENFLQEKFSEARDLVEDEWNEARRELVKAIREDVGPNAKLPSS